MGFLKNPIKAIGRGLSKLPGAKTLAKPVNKALGQTPGLKGVPAAMGMAQKKPAPIGPSAPVVGAALAAPRAPIQDKMGMQGAPPQMSAPPQMPPPQMQPPTEMQGLEAGPAQQQGWGPPPGPPPQAINPQMNPQMQELQRRMGGNTGIARYNGGIGPRFM